MRFTYQTGRIYSFIIREYKSDPVSFETEAHSAAARQQPTLPPQLRFGSAGEGKIILSGCSRWGWTWRRGVTAPPR